MKIAVAAAKDCGNSFGFSFHHRRAQQKHCRRELPLYESWPTQNCWFRAFCCILGQSVVDELHAHKRHDPETYQDMKVTSFCHELVAGTLRPWPRIYKGSLQRQRGQPRPLPPGSKPHIERITTKGEMDYELTDTDKSKGRETGRNKNASCFVCRKYKPKYSITTYCCSRCKTPLCKKDRSSEPGRNQSCKNEHFSSDDPWIKCDGRRKGNMAKKEKVYDIEDSDSE